jgi:hypothetical protein
MRGYFFGYFLTICDHFLILSTRKRYPKNSVNESVRAAMDAQDLLDLTTPNYDICTLIAVVITSTYL